MTRLGAVASGTDVDPWTREKDKLAALGEIAAAFPNYSASGAVLTSQAVYGGAVYLYNGEPIGNILCCVTTAAAGTAPAGLKLGLWSSAATPVCLAVTADLASDPRWTGTGWQACALTSPYAISASGLYYPCVWQNGAFGTTPLQLATGGVNGNFGRAIGSNRMRYGTVKGGATSMTAGDTGTYGVAGVVPYLGVAA